MQSSNKLYLSNLDHLRGCAAFMVFMWHFIHHAGGCAEICYHTIYTSQVTLPFFTLLEQGHSGVALFLCISGYIFTRLTYGKRMMLIGFWQNRLLRLLPLILFVGLCTILLSDNEKPWRTLLHPGGSWTIYLELKYYLILPLLLLAMGKFQPLRTIAILLLITFLYRFYLWYAEGSVQFQAYHRLTGRLDQFIAGSAAFYIEQFILVRYGKNSLRVGGVAAFAGLIALYHYFSLTGGYYVLDGKSPSIIWVFMPLLEGVFYSAIIIGYLTLAIPIFLDKPLSALGRWSYSIYLNHFLLVPWVFLWISTHLFMPEGFYGRLVVAIFIAFPAIVAVSALTYQCIEKPFLRLRKPYLVPATTIMS